MSYQAEAESYGKKSGMTRTTLYLPDSQNPNNQMSERRPTNRFIVHSRNSQAEVVQKDSHTHGNNETNNMILLRENHKSPITALPKKQQKSLSDFSEGKDGKEKDAAVARVASHQSTYKEKVRTSAFVDNNNNVISNPALAQDVNVKANLFGLGGQKDVSSDVIAGESIGVSQHNKEKQVTITNQEKIFLPESKKHSGQIFIKSITSAQGSVTIFNEKAQSVRGQNLSHFGKMSQQRAQR